MPDIKSPGTEPPPQDRDRARKRAQNHFTVQAERDALVKQELAAERAASDAKTAKLRALRLAKEEADREAARLTAETAPAKKTAKAKAKAR
jgi:hypothetical protein